MGLYAVISDIHGPWEDKRAVDLFVGVCVDLRVSHLIINGDLFDFYNLNSHGPKDPEIQTTLDDEYEWGLEFFQMLQDKLPWVKIIFIYGNHEDRLNRFVIKNCPAFTNRLKLENHLELDKRGIEYYLYNQRYRVEDTDLFVQHSPPSYSENAANTSLKKKIDQDHIWGCTHRTDRVVKTGSSGKVYESFMLGWFGDKKIIQHNQREMPEVNRVYKFTKNHETWNCSFCLVSAYKGQHDVQQVVVKNYRCTIGSKVYQG